MSHRLGPSLLVAAGVMVSAWPLDVLFTDPSWRGPLFVTLLAVAASGAAARHRRPSLAPPAQAVVLALVLTWLFGRDTALLGVIPTPATLTTAQALITDAIVTIRSSPPPAPTSPGVVFAFTSGFGLVGLLADVVAVTLRRPLGAVVPLLVPFLAAVANLGTPLPWYHLAALTGVVALLLADGHRRNVRRWVGSHSPPATEMPARAVPAAALWAVALTVAIVAASALPHLPTRFLADGLGRSGGVGQVGFSPSPDLLGDLRSDDTTPVLRYRTDDTAPPPLRISVASHLDGGGWSARSPRATPSDSPAFGPPPGLTQRVATRMQSFAVEDTRLDAPYLAAPGGVVSGTVAGARWNLDPASGVLVTDRRPASYAMSYLTVTERAGGEEPVVTAPLLRTGVITPDDLDTTASTPLLRRTLQQVTADARTPAEQADAIQRWLREDPSFRYSLDLPPTEGRDPVDAFLATRTGYCVQFATTMILMAREAGIPARMATGYLAGSEEGGVRVVRASDAHAWPELYLEDIGWARFEPTPASRAIGAAPEYAPIRETTAAPDPEMTAPRPRPTGAADTAGPSPASSERPDAEGADAGTRSGSAVPPLLGPVLALLLLALLLAAVSPAVAALRHRRRLAAATTPSEQVDEHWRWLSARLADVGVTAPRSATVRAQADAYRSHLDADAPTAAALSRLVEAVEEARYSRSPNLDEARADRARDDARLVDRTAHDQADRRTRLRAFLAPSDGVPLRHQDDPVAI